MASVVVRILCLGALLLGLVAGGPPENTLLWNSVFDVGHAILFILATWLMLGIAQAAFPRSSRKRVVVGTAIATLGIAAASELAQFFDPARYPSVADFLRDAGGVSIFLLIGVGTSRPRARRTMRALALLVATGIAVPLLLVVGLYVERDRAFPTLLAFDGSRWERRFLSLGHATLTRQVAPLSGQSPNSGGLALLSLRPATYPGFVLDEPYPDWRGYERLTFTAVLEEDAPLEITLRIHDRWHNGDFQDRFNRKLRLTPGAQQVVVRTSDIRTAPASRAMDMAQIRGVAIYAYHLERPASIRLGALRLE
ncbi:MAG TPA: VanZ family protein [Vicinamibacterales bacterium]|nr:VanZ family protein [Vicinamibacterales bacterium]